MTINLEGAPVIIHIVWKSTGQIQGGDYLRIHSLTLE